MIIEAISKAIEKNREEKKFEFRCSSAGDCPRKLAYQMLGYEGEPIGARGLLTFLHGNLVEETLMSLLGGVVYDTQLPVVIVDNGLTLTGHIDGLYNWLYDTTDDGCVTRHSEIVVVDFKSINTRGFSRAEKGEVDSKYIIQMNLYMYALKLKTAVLVYFNKDTSHLCEVVLHYDEQLVKHTLLKLHRVKNSTKDNLPGKAYNIDDKADGWRCSYCDFTMLCYPDRHVEISKGKPKYVKTSTEAGVK